ncbi:MAG TPA: TetR/AcrR family transcriptional regulator [Terriglobia bacterium]|nr:TetR/AcrR family transcriptional regulator [Terriglobia bacterium]
MARKQAARQEKPSLWEVQKQERRRAVLLAAKALIAAKGYDKPTIEDIAAAAGLSTPTVYNYFGTKLDLLIALYLEDREIALSEITTIVAKSWKDPLDFFLAVLEADLREDADVPSHALWRQIAAAEVTENEGRHHATFKAINDRHMSAVTTGVRKMVDEGLLIPDTDVKAVAELFRYLSEGLYRKVVATTDTRFAAFKSDAKRQLKVMLAGIRA